MNQSPNPHQNDSFFSRATLSLILYLAAIFFLTFIARIILSPLLPKIEADLHLTHSQAGTLFLLISVGYFISLTGSGYICSKITYHTTIIVSVAAVGVALCALAFSHTIIWLRLSVFMLGMAAGPYLPSGIATLTELVASRHWGKAIAIHEIAPNFAFVAAPVISEILLTACSWRTVIFAMGISCLIMGGIFAKYGQGGHFKGRAPRFSASYSLFSNPSFWMLLILFGLSISSTIGIYTMLPLYLIHDLGFSRPFANTAVGISRIFGLFSALASGWAADRFGSRLTIIYSSVLSGVSTLVLGLHMDSAVIIGLVYVQAMLGPLFFPAGYKMLSSIASPETRGIAVSYTIPIAFVFGGGIIPAFIGMAGDAGSFSAGIMITGGLILSGALLAFYLNIDEK